MDAQEQSVETKTDTSKLSQKDAVYKFIMESLGDQPKSVKLRDLVTVAVRKTVRQKLFLAVKSGDVKLSKQFDDSKLKKYCSGLINNWIKKDKRFN